MKTLIQIFFSLGILFSGFSVICLGNNPVLAVVFLIVTFVLSAIYLILMGINFIGITYIILYVGAIAVLFLFIIMMINIKLADILETGTQYTKNIPLALALGSLFFYEIFTILPFSLNNVSSVSAILNIINKLNILVLNKDIQLITEINTALDPSIADTNFVNFIQIQAVGQGLYTYGAFWLLLCSMILLLAMVAPIFISKISKVHK